MELDRPIGIRDPNQTGREKTSTRQGREQLKMPKNLIKAAIRDLPRIGTEREVLDSMDSSLPMV